MSLYPLNSPLNVLVVEDNRTQAEYLRNILEKKSHEISVAINGKIALQMIQEMKPDLVLTDVMMPEMDGYELCAKIKKDKLTKEIPVFLVTYLYSPIDVIKGLMAGADNFIIKPYEPDYIYSRISDYFLQKKNHTDDSSQHSFTICFSGQSHEISADRSNILNILLSTYETAIRNNSELQIAHERLHYLNAQMEKALSDLKKTNEKLYAKDLEREELEISLAHANKKLQKTSSFAQNLFTEVETNPEFNKGPINDVMKESQIKGISTKPTYRTIQEKFLDTSSFIADYTKIGIISPSWQKIRPLIDFALKSLLQEGIEILNMIPDDIEMYADPLMYRAFFCLCGPDIRHRKVTSIHISLVKKGNTQILVLQTDGDGIADSDKEELFSEEYALKNGFRHYLAKEIFSVTGFSIRETGIKSSGAIYEILCPADSIKKSDSMI